MIHGIYSPDHSLVNKDTLSGWGTWAAFGVAGGHFTMQPLAQSSLEEATQEEVFLSIVFSISLLLNALEYHVLIGSLFTTEFT